MNSVPTTSFDKLHGSLPPDRVPADAKLDGLSGYVEQLLENFTEDVLDPDAIWKDWLSVTGKVCTHNKSDDIARTWAQLAANRKPTLIKATQPRVARQLPGTSWIDVPFTFKTTHDDGLVGLASGTASLVPDDAGKYKIWMLATMLEQYEGCPHPDQPPNSRSRAVGLKEAYAVVVVGAGQSGLSLAGRLGALGIDYVLLEQKAEVGYGWYGKYESVRQHTIKEFNNLPFDRTWKEDDPDLLPAAKVVEGFQNFVRKYSINVSLSTTIATCCWNPKIRRWQLTVRVGDGSIRNISAAHLALAIGAGHASANIPDWPGEELFQGQLLHSISYKNSKAWKGKHGVVVGSATTAHDIAQDMLDAGCSSVTMVQRKKTAVYPIEWLAEGERGLYNTQIPTSVADTSGSIFPDKIIRDMLKISFLLYMEAENQRFEALERAGFNLDRDTPMMDSIQGRYGGYYIDVGISARIASGEIKVKSGVPVRSYTAHGLAFEDGTELLADVIVLATGYNHDYRKDIANIVGGEIAEGLGDFWGMDAAGNLRGVMKPMAPGLWLLGGAAPQARFYSRFIALQIQADLHKNLKSGPQLKLTTSQL